MLTIYCLFKSFTIYWIIGYRYGVVQHEHASEHEHVVEPNVVKYEHVVVHEHIVAAKHRATKHWCASAARLCRTYCQRDEHVAGRRTGC